MAFPDVPDVPGVPPLERAPNFDDTPPEFDSSDGPGVIGDPATAQWGIFKDGQPVILDDSTVSMEYRQEWTIADYPLEGGAFESYDKVSHPFESRVRVSAGGSDANRQSFLDSIAAIAGDLNLYDVVMPERTMPSVNIVHYDYARKNSNGVGLIIVDVWVEEVRVNATQTFTNTKTPSGASPVNDGTIQPQAPTGAQQSAATGVA